MNHLLIKIERRVRYVAGGTALLLGLGVIAVNAGWIKHEQEYERHSWYLTNMYGSIVVMSEYPDEAACRRYEKPGGTACKSGGALQDEASARVLGTGRS